MHSIIDLFLSLFARFRYPQIFRDSTPKRTAFILSPSTDISRHGFSSLLSNPLLSAFLSAIINLGEQQCYVTPRNRRYSSINWKCTRIARRVARRQRGCGQKFCKNWERGEQLLLSTGLLRFPPRVGEFLSFAEF